METLGIVLLRIVVGLTLAAHGGQKLFGWWGGPGFKGWTGYVTAMGAKPPALWAFASGLVEFGGGLALAAGFLTPIAAFAIAGNLLFAILVAHWSKGFFNGKGGIEHPLALAVGAVSVALIGAGPVSVDSALGTNFPEPSTAVIAAIVFLGGSLVAFTTRKVAAPSSGGATT